MVMENESSVPLNLGLQLAQGRFLMGRYNHLLSLDATMQGIKNIPNHW